MFVNFELHDWANSNYLSSTQNKIETQTLQKF